MEHKPRRSRSLADAPGGWGGGGGLKPNLATGGAQGAIGGEGDAVDVGVAGVAP